MGFSAPCAASKSLFQCMALRSLKRVFVQFTPGDPKAVSAREFLQRLTGDRARKSNPACKIDFNIAEAEPHGRAFIDLTVNDGTQLKLHTADFPVQELAKLIERKGNEMELKQILGEVKGFDPWRPENRLGTTQR